MIVRRLRLLLLALLFASGGAVAGDYDPTGFDTGTIPAPHLFMPTEALNAAIVLISERDGWTARETAMAETLRTAGTLVIGIDLPKYLDALDHDGGACIYTVTSIEGLSQQLQRKIGQSGYHLPVIAGIGAGGALALAIAAQTPDATVAQTLAVDPEEGVAFGKDLCTQAPKRRVGDRTVYGFEATLADPVRIVFTPAADPAGRAHAVELKAQQDTVVIAESSNDAGATLLRDLAALTAERHEDPLDLPLTVLDAKPARDMLAVIYSGDGGWRDIDKSIGAALQAEGIPVVGVDALRYFWDERTPQGTADDLARILRHYRQRWGVGKVLLIGYSFGANILPPTYNHLPAADRASVAQLSLLAFANRTDFQVSVSGWLGVAGEKPGEDPVDDVKPIDPALVQCFYGTEETDTACPRLRPLGIDVFGITGGHHFDRDYVALTARIVAGLDRERTDRPEASR